MRKIERLMNAAIADGRDWKSANTEVIMKDNDAAVVYLHGNKIAEVGEGYIQIWDGGWQSNTTKSRLNAIFDENGLPGEGVFQKNFVWKVRLSDGSEIPFFSGMRLN
jgi:hypothetical protein